MNIEVSANIGDKFLLGLEEVLNVIDSINRSDDDEDVIIFQNNIFVTPLFILPLLVYVNGCNKRIRYQYSNNYLNTIQFGSGGLKPDELESGIFHDLMNRCSLKTYIPIISFPTDLKFTRERNERWFIWILCDALGKCTFLKSKSIDQFSALPDIATWQGTIVAMRIPYINEGFNYIDFVE